MNNKTILLGLTVGLLFVNGMFANDPNTEKEKFDINSINYIEEDMDFDLGFDTADYLPEGFDAYQVYFDLNGVEYIQEVFAIEFDTKENLPEDFDAFAYPSDLQSMNFIDDADSFEVGFDTQTYLPLNFNAFTKQ
ncbi:MAG: hypothetical protein HKP42_04820 [Maribacter sp.]|nr:hypothetical protein [Maribacter sp.]